MLLVVAITMNKSERLIQTVNAYSTLVITDYFLTLRQDYRNEKHLNSCPVQ